MLVFTQMELLWIIFDVHFQSIATGRHILSSQFYTPEPFKEKRINRIDMSALPEQASHAKQVLLQIVSGWRVSTGLIFFTFNCPVWFFVCTFSFISLSWISDNQIEISIKTMGKSKKAWKKLRSADELIPTIQKDKELEFAQNDELFTLDDEGDKSIVKVTPRQKRLEAHRERLAK